MPLFGNGVSRICAVAASATAAGLLGQIRTAMRATSTVELRLDWLRNDAERRKFLKLLKKTFPANATLIATCRRKVAGGEFDGDISSELNWLVQARDSGCTWCDLEVETLRELPDQSAREYPLPKILLSMHDFERTPRLPRTLNTSAYGEVAGVKIAANSQNLQASVQLLGLARRSRELVAVPMGEIGLPARILALRAGSSLAYAPVSNATAPGQVSLREMKDLYRAHALNRATKIYGVIGDPIAHSLSPMIHNAGFIARSLNSVYLPFRVDNLREFLAAIGDFELRGFSVTLPHKHAMLKYLDDCEELAARIGAVNTVLVRKNGKLYGCNTDYLGVLRALEGKLKLAQSKVLIVGAGGSARAAAFAVAQAGASVAVCSRREKAASELARAVGGDAVPRRALAGETFDVIINATPVGMSPETGISPLAARELNCQIVMDLIYTPQKTELLKIAARKKIPTISGVEMFLAQAFAQFELFTGKKAPQAPMRRAVLAALDERTKTSTARGSR